MQGTRTTRRGLRVAALALCAMSFAMACAPVTGATQSLHTLTVRADNDAFNFWTEPGRRPDRDYTSGAFLRYDGGDAPWWGRPLARRLSPCQPQVLSCRTKTLEIGQQLYTPERSRESLTPPPGARPNAGWLFIREASRALHPNHANEIGVVLGVTGKPALGREMQEFFHSLSPSYNRPTDWSDQLGFAPGLIVSYAHTRRVSLGTLGALRFDMLPRAGVEAGNVLATAELGIRLRTGFRLRHPWLPARADAPMELSLSGGGTARGIARDLFLDGRTEAEGEGPGHEPFVYEKDWSARFQYRFVSVTYGAVTKSRAYATGPASHTWSTMAVGLTFVR